MPYGDKPDQSAMEFNGALVCCCCCCCGSNKNPLVLKINKIVHCDTARRRRGRPPSRINWGPWRGKSARKQQQNHINACRTRRKADCLLRSVQLCIFIIGNEFQRVMNTTCLLLIHIEPSLVDNMAIVGRRNRIQGSTLTAKRLFPLWLRRRRRS